ncbi:hypothetical protein [Elizabethkingia ursingii]|uniref:Uncharacterized protein n=1 Tax=Elizabethkingia ursingii TaxID=1756150 RepID=A0AAJ3TNP9_9FLAO|nr:hypothetical protein [Elizabethkingia ursingii]AQX08015.1 hypothetical protein BBD34_04865 [Elizabethkingia ursingii]OPB73631.1 hypothetical protein BAY32_11355 [Elizabethkingia ursingii]
MNEDIKAVPIGDIPIDNNPADDSFLVSADKNKNPKRISLKFFNDKVNSGFAGTADLNTQPSTTKYERWKIADPGTYPNFKEIVNNIPIPITITTEELKQNDIVLSVTNGVAKKELSEKIRDEKDTEGGVFSYDKASFVLGTYIDIESEDINYLPLDYYALKKDNTRAADYPYTCSVIDIDVEHFDQLRYFACKSGGDPLLYCSALGIKTSGEKVVLLNATGADTTTPTDIVLDVKDFISASISWQNKQAVIPIFTKIRLNGGNTVQGDISEIKSKIKDIKPDSKAISTDNFQLGALRNDNVYEADTAQKSILNVSTEGYTELLYKGFPSTVGASNVNKYATILGIKSTGEVNVLEKAAATSNTEILNKIYDVTKYPNVSFSWGNYGASAGSTPIIELSGKSIFNENTERIINLSENSYRELEVLTQTITLSVKSSGSFGNMNVFRFTGGGILFSGEISMDKNSDVYDPSKVNTVYAYSEYGVVKCLIEN